MINVLSSPIGKNLRTINANNKIKINVSKTVFEGKNKGYYAWIKRGGIQIEVIDKSKENVLEIQNYLEFLFCHKYIGISIENNQDMRLDLKNVKCFKV